MKIVINKAEPKKVEIKAGDIISLSNPNEQHNFLLVNFYTNIQIAAVNLANGELVTEIRASSGFEQLVDLLLKNFEWDEWALIKSENSTLALDCKNADITQRSKNKMSFKSFEELEKKITDLL